jgi:Cu(I)/Ag(I) efflux system membrane protein CusA/SilA
MIERIIEFSIRQRTLVLLAGLLLALGGIWAVYHTPVDAIPDLSENQVIVFTQWPGHSPQEIEAQVTYPLSLQLQGLAGVRVVRSSSDFNFSMISVIFEDGVDFVTAREEVARRLPQAHDALPAGVVPALAPDAAATGQIFWYTVEGAGDDLARLRSLQDWYIRPQLQSVPGVAEVASVGGHTREYGIEVDPRRLRALDLPLSDVLRAVSGSNATAGGDVIHKANAEFIVHAAGWLGQAPGGFDPAKAFQDLQNIVIPRPGREPVRLSEVAVVQPVPGPRRGVLEKDGDEVTGGVVLMRQGENALEVTRRLQDKVLELQTGLPAGVRIVPFYDRTPLIRGAIGTVTGTLLEAMLTATVCVVLVLLHFRTSFVIVLTLPLAALASFLLLWLLRRLGVADVQTNIMSLAGIAISIGVLVDSSIVMAENVMHCLREKFGDRPVTGDVRAVVLAACRTVGRPIFFSVVIMLLSFLPVFALGGLEGKMFRPLAFTKCFALLAVAVLAITLVPALCTIFIRGRLRGEMDSWVVRGVIGAYQPVLAYVLSHPLAIVWLVGATFLAGLAPLGSRFLSLSVLAAALLACGWTARQKRTAAAAILSLLMLALVAEQQVTPLGYEPITPLDEGMVMDMPITVPWASVAQVVDDLKARDMVFCRYPEVDMVVGKAGRAETSTDPAPLDMIETMINFRPNDLWPRRKLRPADAERQARAVLDAVSRAGLVEEAGDQAARARLLEEAVSAALPVFDVQMREYAYQRNLEFERELGHRLIRTGHKILADMVRDNGTLARPLSETELLRLAEPAAPAFALHLARDLTWHDVRQLAGDTVRQMEQLGFLSVHSDPLRYRPGLLARAGIQLDALFGGTPPTPVTYLHGTLDAARQAHWHQHIHQLNGELTERAAPVFTRLIVEELLGRSTMNDSALRAAIAVRRRRRQEEPAAQAQSGGHHHGQPAAAPPIQLDPHPVLDRLEAEQSHHMASGLLLWPAERAELAGAGSELDRVMQMPGWTNVWTMPIQNRVDMLATGVNTTVGVRVLGRRLDDVVRVSQDVAAVVAKVPGAVNVVADQLRGKGFLEIHPDRERTARCGVSVADVNELIEVALGGKVVTRTVEGRERHAVRVRYPPAWRADEEAVGKLPVPVRGPGARYVRLGDVASVHITEGPAAIKSENGLLRNYVRLNVRDRDSSEFVAEARRTVAAAVPLPAGVYLEWTGQFEHEEQVRHTLPLLLPVVLGLIFLVLYRTYHDFADAVLMMLAVPGALAGGVFFQWLFGCKFSVTVWVGYIACFGMATATGIIMLVYLREAVARAGGLEKLTREQLRQAVMEGAVHRLRPKLLTEGTMVLGLAPLLWSSGVGAEVIKPMVLPVLGGILVADEVIDLFLPVLFWWVRCRRWEQLHAAGPAKPGLVGGLDAE